MADCWGSIVVAGCNGEGEDTTGDESSAESRMAQDSLCLLLLFAAYSSSVIMIKNVYIGYSAAERQLLY